MDADRNAAKIGLTPYTGELLILLSVTKYSDNHRLVCLTRQETPSLSPSLT